MAARVLAVVAAVAMVAGAMAVRAGIDESEERQGAVLRLTCASELAGVCDALAEAPGYRVEATVEPAADTADALVALPPGRPAPFDGWLVAGPWPQIAAEARERAGLDPLVSPGPVLARSPLVLAVRGDRAAVFQDFCAAAGVGWKCLGDAAGRPWTDLGGSAVWGSVKPGHPAVGTGPGLAVFGAATVAWFGRTDLARDDLDERAFGEWLTRLVRSVPNHPPSPLELMLVRPSAFDAVATTEAEAGPLLEASRRDDEPRLFYPSPVATADVVLGSAAGRPAQLLAELVAGPEGRRALGAAGWRVPGATPAAGVDATRALPAGSGLPSPGLLAALRGVIDEVAR